VTVSVTVMTVTVTVTVSVSVTVTVTVSVTVTVTDGVLAGEFPSESAEKYAKLRNEVHFTPHAHTHTGSS